MARALIDRNRAREARRQAQLFDRLANQFRARLKAELASAMRDMVAGWEHTKTVLIPRDFRARLEATYQQMAIAAITAFSSRILDQGKRAGLILERKEDFAATMNRMARDYVNKEAVRRRINDVTETTRRQIIGAVNRGYQEGLGTDEISRTIRDVVEGLAKYRADTIARTETHGAANYGSDAAAKLTGLPLRREWLAAQDERTRATHAAANGQIVGQDEPFQVGSASLMYPGDPSGPVEEVVNCRCALGYIVDDGLDEEPASDLGTVPDGPQGPEFAYETVSIPSTVAAVAKFIEEYGIATSARLEGFRMATIEPALRAALETTERFALTPLNGIGPATRYGMRQLKGANAAVYPVQGLLHLPTKFGNLADYQRQNIRALASAPKYEAVMRANLIKFASRYDAEVIKRAEMIAPGNYGWTFSSMGKPSEQARAIIYHEYGHVLHLMNKEIGYQINNFLDNYTPRLKGWANLLSEYAHANNKEYVAEAFSLYMTGPRSQYFRIHPKLLEIFEKWDRKK